ncbi:demethylmenaquinone methyltransferase [Klugiella xanthotipulae]|uniref:Demethylmenaquinone methyltransferase n=1 Tax=Klugiella xanthotipulae TaxID=244735 RepID=A0A543HZ49_9MICO|nr:class I SAM-dependent methyltransferase [Klugiella xanthotipulae]TQM63626.1 demethylmenaquinone methyltransferase/2-methoxy-6-polyprenyl-1,4-benzoquinol methylase [Klugiella xanthotipulae]
MIRPDSTKDSGLVSRMFDEVSPRYDLTNDILSLGNSRLWRVTTTRAVQPRKGMRILDIAAGTGTSSAAFARSGAQVVAADFSPGMLAVGRRRNARVPNIEFVEADATQLPFDDDSFDATTISFGLRNVDRPQVALAEMYRVTKPGGRVVICEFSRPPLAIVREPYYAYTKHVLPRVAGFINGAGEAYDYLNDSIREWPDQLTLAGWLRDAGFNAVEYRNLTGGLVALHRGFVSADAHTTSAGARVDE